MFKLILLLTWLDPDGEIQTRQAQYNLFFPSIEECQEQMRDTMEITEQVTQAGGRILGVSYACVFDPSLRGSESDA